MFNLYYLVNQAGDINGDKQLYVGSPFDSVESAQDQATLDNVSHYSIELISNDEDKAETVFIC